MVDAILEPGLLSEIFFHVIVLLEISLLASLDLMVSIGPGHLITFERLNNVVNSDVDESLVVVSFKVVRIITSIQNLKQRLR